MFVSINRSSFLLVDSVFSYMLAPIFTTCFFGMKLPTTSFKDVVHTRQIFCRRKHEIDVVMISRDIRLRKSCPVLTSTELAKSAMLFLSEETLKVVLILSLILWLEYILFSTDYHH